MKQLNIYGRASKEGKLKLSNIKLFNQFLRENSGQKLSIEVKVIDRNGTDAQLYHIRKIMLPRIKNAMRDFGEIMDDEGTELFMLSQTSYNRVDSFNELDKKELSEVIDELKIFASRDLNIIIENP